MFDMHAGISVHQVFVAVHEVEGISVVVVDFIARGDVQ